MHSESGLVLFRKLFRKLPAMHIHQLDLLLFFPINILFTLFLVISFSSTIRSSANMGRRPVPERQDVVIGFNNGAGPSFSNKQEFGQASAAPMRAPCWSPASWSCIMFPLFVILWECGIDE